MFVFLGLAAVVSAGFCAVAFTCLMRYLGRRCIRYHDLGPDE